MNRHRLPPNEGLFQIGRIAELVGVAASALRFYEREGLIRPAARSRAGYRLYDSTSVEHIRFIRAGQAIGFALEDMKALLVLDEGTSCGKVQSMLKQRLSEVEEKLAGLQKVKATLSDALVRCRGSNRGCAVVVGLKEESKKLRSK